MAAPSTHDVTVLLRAWAQGDQSALERLVPLAEAEVNRVARRYLACERPGHSLQRTALVYEAYIRLIDWQAVQWQDRAHFFGVSARLMRYILVGHAKRRALEVADERGPDLVALDQALETLASYDPREGRIVGLRFFGGLSVEETAEVLKVAPITVMREWNRAKAWLYDELSNAETHPSGRAVGR
jgi:RNA polymerase sigma factor (TIGR02999 family)